MGLVLFPKRTKRSEVSEGPWAALPQSDVCLSVRPSVCQQTCTAEFPELRSTSRQSKCIFIGVMGHDEEEETLTLDRADQ